MRENTRQQALLFEKWKTFTNNKKREISEILTVKRKEKEETLNKNIFGGFNLLLFDTFKCVLNISNLASKMER